MMGNAYGIPWGSFLRRFKGQADPRYSLSYELIVVITSFIIIPLGLIQALVMKLFDNLTKK